MATYDWIVIGAGMTGAALSYELVSQGFSVSLLEQAAEFPSATRYSYGGIAYWSGTTELTRQLCAEGIARHRSLSEELAAPTHFLDGDLLLTIPADADPQAIAASYAHFALPPRLLDVAAACALEPLLNPRAIAAALTVKHGRIDPIATASAYLQAFQRRGGTYQLGRVTGLLRGPAAQVTGVVADGQSLYSQQVAVCAGGWTRSLLHDAEIPVRTYFTHAEVIDTPPVDFRLNTLVMPAVTARFAMEATATQNDALWDEPGQEAAEYIIDAGVVQLPDGRLRIGQISRTLTDPQATVDAAASEALLRDSIGRIMPTLKTLPGTWAKCLVAFSGDRLPLIGAIPGVEGVQVFSGFNNPWAIVPPLAQRFAAQAMTGKPDNLLTQLLPSRFG
jgi:glycine/D-amino acid oxidase-like deaminating enzyme